jgi:alkylation response protein AidB-like acyl-CoA dehydrogenase
VRLGLTSEELRLRDDVRAFLRTYAPDASAVPHSLDERMTFLQQWQAQCYAAGYVGRAWPKDCGGGGRPPSEQLIVDQEMAAFGAPERVSIVGLDVLGPAILAYGSEEQKSRFVPPILSAQEIWCQGFSEPDAGSDLASLRTSAEETAEGFVINGQKTWTSWGQYARWCGVLARTNTDVPKHKGISLLIVDMESPGVEIRPMTQITGHAEFCELFLTDVLVPKDRLLGERGQGWAIAMHVVSHERGTAALPRQATLRMWFDQLVAGAAVARDGTGSLLANDLVQAQLARALIEVEVLRHHASRTMSAFINGGKVGPESSGVKLLMASAEQNLGLTAIEVLGDANLSEFWRERYLYSRAATVYGGTQQIQREIIADHLLRLPKE